MLSMIIKIFKILGYLIAGYIIVLILGYTIDGITGWGKDLNDFGFTSKSAYIAVFLAVLILGNFKLARFFKMLITKIKSSKYVH